MPCRKLQFSKGPPVERLVQRKRGRYSVRVCVALTWGSGMLWKRPQWTLLILPNISVITKKPIGPSYCHWSNNWECVGILLQGMAHEFCCRQFGNQMQNRLPPPLDQQLRGWISELTEPNLDFPRILNHDFWPIFQCASVSFLNGSASCHFISGILYALDIHP
jgi:hypothetical protein